MITSYIYIYHAAYGYGRVTVSTGVGQQGNIHPCIHHGGVRSRKGGGHPFSDSRIGSSYRIPLSTTRCHWSSSSPPLCARPQCCPHLCLRVRVAVCGPLALIALPLPALRHRHLAHEAPALAAVPLVAARCPLGRSAHKRLEWTGAAWVRQVLGQQTACGRGGAVFLRRREDLGLLRRGGAR